MWLSIKKNCQSARRDKSTKSVCLSADEPGRSVYLRSHTCCTGLSSFSCSGFLPPTETRSKVQLHCETFLLFMLAQRAGFRPSMSTCLTLRLMTRRYLSRALSWLPIRPNRQSCPSRVGPFPLLLRSWEVECRWGSISTEAAEKLDSVHFFIHKEKTFTSQSIGWHPLIVSYSTPPSCLKTSPCETSWWISCVHDWLKTTVCGLMVRAGLLFSGRVNILKLFKVLWRCRQADFLRNQQQIQAFPFFQFLG